MAVFTTVLTRQTPLAPRQIVRVSTQYSLDTRAADRQGEEARQYLENSILSKTYSHRAPTNHLEGWGGYRQRNWCQSRYSWRDQSCCISKDCIREIFSLPSGTNGWVPYSESARQYDAAVQYRRTSSCKSRYDDTSGNPEGRHDLSGRYGATSSELTPNDFVAIINAVKGFQRTALVASLHCL